MHIRTPERQTVIDQLLFSGNVEVETIKMLGNSEKNSYVEEHSPEKTIM